MRVGFLINQIDFRGTGTALYDYAQYNETILNNESFILVPEGAAQDRDMHQRFVNRFGRIHYTQEAKDLNLEFLYHIKSGEQDGFNGIKGVPYGVHAVFNYQPHGDKYAMVSEWLANEHGAQFVPHVVSLPDVSTNLRARLGIPEGDVVFGRYGGADSFDISWAWNAINRILRAKQDVWFLFMNTNQPDIEFYDSRRVLFIVPTVEPINKRTFINTCDAMLHARTRGETFGIAVGEFAICNKTIFTYAFSPEKAHLDELLNSGIPALYVNEDGLFIEMLQYTTHMISQKYVGGYNRYTPQNVMAKFKEVFLD